VEDKEGEIRAMEQNQVKRPRDRQEEISSQEGGGKKEGGEEEKKNRGKEGEKDERANPQ
jgi:hypothetical protein